MIAKAVLSVIYNDKQSAAEYLQLCAGLLPGCEAAVHSIRKLFSSPDVEGVLLVGVSNAYDSLNQQASLHNIQHLGPSFSTILINIYRRDVNLYIGRETLLPKEDATQGHPLAMLM